MKPRLMHRREVVALDVADSPGRAHYLAAKAGPDGAWYTDDINKAKVYRHPGLARAEILAHDAAWLTFSPRVVSAWGVPGYIDRPSRAAKRQKAEAEHSARVLTKMGVPDPYKR